MDFSLSVEHDGKFRNLVPSDKGEQGPPPPENRNFREMEKAIFHGPKQDGCRLLIDDVPLPLVDQPRPGVWVWEPGFYAGEVEAILQDATGDCRRRWHLDVSPDTNKLGRDAFVVMLQDIYEWDPTFALGTEPARRQFGLLGKHQDPVIEFLRLRYRVTEIERSLRGLLREPIRSLTRRRRLSRLHLVRRADRQTARSLLRQPTLPASVGAIQPRDLLSFIQCTEQPLADVPHVIHQYDNATNRCLFYALQALKRRCKVLRDQLFVKSAQDDSPIAQRWPEWKKCLDSFAKTIETAERSLPFSEVTRAEMTAAGLNAVSADPLCARFWRVGWEALRHGVAGLQPADWLPLNPTWEIYERWCFLALRCWLNELLPQSCDWRENSRSGTERVLAGKLKSGASVQLHLQRTFSSSENECTEFWSISNARRPDIVLDWRRGDERGFLIFDAKYRVTRANVLDAMASAHIYNDSLRMYRKRPVASVLLTPASTELPWLETPVFFDEHGSGVLPLHPGHGLPCWFNDRIRGLL